MPGDQEKSPFPPVVAEPEPPLSSGPLLDELHQIQGGPISRRKVVGSLIVGAAAVVLAAREVSKRANNTSSAHEEESTPEIDTGPKVNLAGRKEDGSYFFTDVAEYIDLNEFVYRDLYDKHGNSEGMEAPIIHEFNPEKKFDEAPKRSIDPKTKLAKDVKLVRLAIDAESGSPLRIMLDPDDPNDDIPIWLGFAIENPNNPKKPIWTDEYGNILDDDTVDVVSPIFTKTITPKRK